MKHLDPNQIILIRKSTFNKIVFCLTAQITCFKHKFKHEKSASAVKTQLNALMFITQYLKTSKQEQENTLYNDIIIF